MVTNPSFLAVVAATKMAKKRGRPAKVTPSTSKQHGEHDHSTIESIPLDFETLDDIDFDALSPKQAEKVLTALDELRMKVSAKTLNTKVDEEEARSKDEEEKNKDSSNDGSATLTRADQNENMIDTRKKGPTVWENFDISKLRNAGGKL
ncbi:hypothetical protein RIF29_14564 [Crotalaria pallida]|uniref:Uncharacterized protein n=1 Tax=Crotalaria pallida TaxID=3830 RepID=A0AAN9FBV7_CROPI